jgi:hypothetical protein
MIDVYAFISAVRIDLMKIDVSAGEFMRPWWPVSHVREAWIPQTICDQVWCLFEFADVLDRTTWETTLINGPVYDMLDRSLVTQAEHYGWVIRDFNGFEIRKGINER